MGNTISYIFLLFPKEGVYMIDYTNIRKALESYFDDKDSGYLIKFDNEDCIIDIYKHVYKGESYDIYGTSISMVPKIIDGNIDTVKTFTNSLISSYNKDNILDMIEQESFVSIINGDDCIRGTLRYNHKMKQLNILSVDNDKIYEGVRFEHESLDDAYKDLEVII